MELTQRFTLYDLLSMVFPGCFLLWDIMSFVDVDQYIDDLSYITDHEVLYCCAFFITSYILGMAWNAIIGEVWRKFIKTISESCLRNEMKNKKDEFFVHWNKLSADTNTERYKLAYSIVREDKSVTSINSLESQISMLRNMAIPFAVWIGTIIYHANSDVCFSIIIGGLVFLFVFSLAFIRHNRLYHLVLVNFLRIKRVKSNLGS